MADCQIDAHPVIKRQKKAAAKVLPSHWLKLQERDQSDVKNHPASVPDSKTYNTVLKKSGDRLHHVAESRQSPGPSWK